MLASPLGNGGKYRKSNPGSPVTDGAYMPPIIDLKILEWANVASTSSVIVKRSVLIDHDLFFSETQPNGEDWDLWKRILSDAGVKLGYLSIPTFALDRVCHGGAPTNYDASH